MRTKRGASLIDTVVGVSLMLLIFVGIAGAFQLSIELVSNNKARIGASALAPTPDVRCASDETQSCFWKKLGLEAG